MKSASVLWTSREAGESSNRTGEVPGDIGVLSRLLL
jgi:hypothetical protein